MTVDRAFVLGSAGIDRQWGYTALSRARAESRLYLAADDRALALERLETGGRHLDETDDALGRLARDLARDAAQEPASWERSSARCPGWSAAWGWSSSPATAQGTQPDDQCKRALAFRGPAAPVSWGRARFPASRRREMAHEDRDLRGVLL